MKLATIILIALALSTDAFAAAIGKGSALHKPRFTEALKAGIIFGVIEAIAPVLGWLLGSVAAEYIIGWDHWIAFCLLSGLGLHMIRSGFTKREDPDVRPSKHTFLTLAITGVATSIDAMAVGVGLAFIDANIFSTAIAIGLATMVMVTLGIMVGRVVGSMLGQRAEVVGGLVLIGIGCVILASHMGYEGLSLSLHNLSG